MSDLHAKLQRFLFQYRNTPHTTTGLTPSELFLGRDVRTRLSMLRPEVSEHIRVKQEKQLLAGPQATREFLEGDRVWVRNYHTPEKWEKSMVIAKCGSVDYQVQVGAHAPLASSCRSNATRSRYSSPRVRKRPTRSVDVKRSNSMAMSSTYNYRLLQN